MRDCIFIDKESVGHKIKGNLRRGFGASFGAISYCYWHRIQAKRRNHKVTDYVSVCIHEQGMIRIYYTATFT